MEVEACLLDDKALPVNAHPLIKELCSKYKVDSEYGKCQFEVITDPISMHNLSTINSFFEEFLDFLASSINKVYKNRHVIPVFLGGNPSPEIFKRKFVTRKERYQNIYNSQIKTPDIELEGQVFKARDIATAIQGFHLHLQGKNPVYTSNMFNYLLNINSFSPVIGLQQQIICRKAIFIICTKDLFI